MSVSLSVYKILNINEDIFKREKFTSSYQANMGDFKIADKVGSSKSILELNNYDEVNDKITFNVIHYSDTIHNPVRIFLDEMHELTGKEEQHRTEVIEGGYQEVYTFDVDIDFRTSEIFIFTKNKVARSFINRLKKSKYFDYENIYFDLSRIDEVPDFDNIWGAWQDSKGRCKKKAYFGIQIHKDEGVEIKNITSFNAEYEYENNIIDLIISKECRISSRSSIVTKTDLYRIYNNLKDNLNIQY